jgi:hypothetical protein
VQSYELECICLSPWRQQDIVHHAPSLLQLA